MNNKDKNKLQKEYELLKQPVPKTEAEKTELEEIILDNFCPGCSGSDCTGLIPAKADDEEKENYRELYPYSVPVKED